MDDNNPANPAVGPRYCVNCKSEFIDPGTPKYRRCAKAEPSPRDATLCAVMRRSDGSCGPGATLWEPKDG